MKKSEPGSPTNTAPPRPRAYVQRKRAVAAQATAERILAAGIAAFLAGGEEPTLEDVAGRAGVTVQTVLRRYGSKEGLFAACAAHGSQEIQAQRGAVAPGDVAGAIENLLTHYDAWGDRALRLLWLEVKSPAAARIVGQGRGVHRDWVERAFAPLVASSRGAERKRRMALLSAATDVYVWKLLHRDQGLSRAQTFDALVALVTAILATPASTEPSPPRSRR